MIQITAQTRILVAVEALDFRKGNDGLARVWQERLESDPFCGWLFVFRNRRQTSLKILAYNGLGSGYVRSACRADASLSGRRAGRRRRKFWRPTSSTCCWREGTRPRPEERRCGGR